MKKLLICIAFFLLSEELHAYDISGLQPLAPNGVFSTFSSETLPAGKASVEIAVEHSKEPDFLRSQVRGAYGLSNGYEILITVPFVFNYMNSESGIEDIAMGFKHRFFDEDRIGPSLAYIITASLPSGDRRFSTGGRLGLGLVLSKRIGPFSGNFNIFYQKPGKGSLQDEIRFLSGIELATTHNSDLLLEFIARKVHFAKEYDQLESRFGYRFRASDNIYTTVGVGADFKTRTPEYRLMFSVCFTNVKGKSKLRKIYEAE